jgi:hypothetical protein
MCGVSLNKIKTTIITVLQAYTGMHRQIESRKLTERRPLFTTLIAM